MVYNSMDFPYAEFGEEIKREVRLVISPQTTGETRLSLVLTTLPAGAVSEGHVHDDFDEYIYFDIGGKVLLDGLAADVPPQGIVHAKAGVNHECVNASESDTLHLVCVFVPPLKPYGKYGGLIEQTNAYLAREGIR